MSYILDALRRADSERERGTIPGIHAQPVPLLPDEEPTPARVAPWVWVAAALGVIVVLLGAFVWALMRPDMAPARAVAEAAAIPQARVIAPPPIPTQSIPAQAAPTPLGATPGALRPELPLPAPVLPKPRHATAPTTRANAATKASTAAEPAAVRRPPPAASAAGATAKAADAASTTPAEAPRIYAQSELPEEIRRGVPALVVNGSVFAKNAADRFLIINGQIVHEKDTVAPDVVLEQIKLRAAVLATKGYRFEITY